MTIDSHFHFPRIDFASGPYKTSFYCIRGIVATIFLLYENLYMEQSTLGFHHCTQSAGEKVQKVHKVDLYWALVTIYAHICQI
jgi:hypothetical protein